MSKLPPRVIKGQVQGKRHSQEDRLIIHFLQGSRLMGIADGHGGDQTAELIAGHSGIRESLQNIGSPYSARKIKKAFCQLNARTGHLLAGSTLSVLLDEPAESLIKAANVGDSPIIIVSKSGNIYQSTDQDSKNPEEIARLARENIPKVGPYFYIPGKGGLQVSRDFGATGQLNAFIPEPYTYCFNRKEIAFALLVSDGIKDAYENQETSAMTSLIEDFIEKALILNPGDTLFTDRDMVTLAGQYSRYHPDDMSIVLTTFNDPPSGTLTRQTGTRHNAVTVAKVTAGTAVISLSTYWYYMKRKAGQPRRHRLKF